MLSEVVLTLHSSLLLRVVSADDRSQWGRVREGRQRKNHGTSERARREERSVIDEKGSFGIHPSSSLETRARVCEPGKISRPESVGGLVPTLLNFEILLLLE